MKLKSLSAALALVLSLFVGGPAQASDYECPEKVGKANFCGVFTASEISRDGKYIYAAELAIESDIASKYNEWDLQTMWRLVRIQVSNGRVTQLLGWQEPETLVTELGRDRTRESSILFDIDLSPDGKQLLMHTYVSKEKFNSSRARPELIETTPMRAEISVMNLQNKRITNLSEKLKLQDPFESEWGPTYESIQFAVWSSNSREVKFLVHNEKDMFTSHRVRITSPTRMYNIEMDYFVASSNGRYGTGNGETERAAFKLFNATNNRFVRHIKGTELFGDWDYVFRVLPKDSGREFFAVYATYFSPENTTSPGAVFAVDAKGTRSELFRDDLGILAINYAERGKVLLIHGASEGLIVMDGTPVKAAAVKINGPCEKVNTISSVSGKAVKCTKSGSKLIWKQYSPKATSNDLVPLGAYFTMVDWTLRLTKVNSDVSTKICSENMFNDGCTLNDDWKGVPDPESTKRWVEFVVEMKNRSKEDLSPTMGDVGVLNAGKVTWQGWLQPVTEDSPRDITLVPGGKATVSFYVFLDKKTTPGVMALKPDLFGSKTYYFKATK